MESIALRVAARFKKKLVSDEGNTIYEYSERQISRRNNEKAKRLEKLRKSVHKVRAQVKKDLNSKDPETALIALVVGLMDHTAERVGNETSKEEGHVGVTGWQKSHVTFSKGKAIVKYVGKSGVKQKKTVTEKALVSALKKAHGDCKDGDLFCHEGGKITAAKVNDYLDPFGISAKDLRGLHANSRMQEALKAARKAGGELPSDPKKRKAQLAKEFKKALEQTAEDVGHEPETLKSQYLVPGLEDEYMQGRVMDKMVKTAVRVAKAIDKNSVDRWRKDLRIMTKIYREIDADISYGADEGRVREAQATFEHARKLFRNFRENFFHWACFELLPKATTDRPETFMQKEIRRTAWDLKDALDGHQLFPVFHQDKSPDWSKIRNERDRSIKRYQTKATKAFKEVDDYLDMKPEGKLERRAPVEHMEVGGVQVILLNFGREDEDDKENDLEIFLRRLKGMVADIKQAGFAGAVKGLTVTVDFDQKKWDVNGQYSPASDTLSMFPMGLAGDNGGHGTFVHECGHRFYFKELPVASRNHWEEVMNSKSVEITAADVQRFADIIGRKIDPEKLWEMSGDDDRLRAALPHAKGPEDEAKFRELAPLPLKPWDEKVFDQSRYTKILEGRIGERVQFEEITEYGNTNPMEAFAEVFRLWVIKGPRAVKPWTREFFSQVCRVGGAKTASLGSVVTARRVAERYLQGAA